MMLRWINVVAILPLVACGQRGDAQTTAGADATDASPSSGSDGDDVESESAGTSGAATDDGTTAEDEGSTGDSTGEDEPLDPPPGEYGLRAPLIEANSEMAVAEAAGKIYVLGGYPASGETQDTVQVYEPSTDTWELTTPLPLPLHHPVAVGVQGRLYSLGGQTNGGDTDRTIVFDPQTAVWTDLAPMPTARGAGVGVAIGTTIYVAGGRPPAGNAFEAYDVVRDTWTVLPDLPQAYPDRNHLAGAAIDGKVFIVGGRYGGGGFASPLTDSLDVYDPRAGTWSTAQSMLRPRGGNNGVAAHGCLYTWGGEGGNIGEPNNVFPDHDVYDPQTDTWTALAPLPTPVHGVTGAVFLGGLIYIPGGGTSQGGSSGSTIFQVYHPAQHCR